MAESKEQSKTEEKKIVPTVSRVLPDGTLIELLYRPEEHRTALALFSAGRWTMQAHIDVGGKRRLVPFSRDNNLQERCRAPAIGAAHLRY
jgi:hypothetical protein